MTEVGAAIGNGAGGGNFVSHVLRGRWFMVFASLLIMAGAGATYLFGVYSKQIKASLGYDQTTLNILGTCKDLGASIGVLSSLIAEVTPTWFVLLCGVFLNFTGYFLVWLAVVGKMAKPTVWLMGVFIAMGANSQNFVNIGSLVTSVKNFPDSRGIMLGLLKGDVGLSGAILTQFYQAMGGREAGEWEEEEGGGGPQGEGGREQPLSTAAAAPFLSLCDGGRRQWWLQPLSMVA